MNDTLLLGLGLWSVFWATPPGWLVIGALVEPELALRGRRTLVLWCALTLAALFLQVLLDSWAYACRDSPLAVMYSGIVLAMLHLVWWLAPEETPTRRLALGILGILVLAQLWLVLPLQSVVLAVARVTRPVCMP